MLVYMQAAYTVENKDSNWTRDSTGEIRISGVHGNNFTSISIFTDFIM